MAGGNATAAQQGGGGSSIVTLQRRRLGGASRKSAAGRSLGAVRLKEAPVDEVARVLQEIENNGVAPAAGSGKPAPLTELAPAREESVKVLSPTARFESELAEQGTSDKWFDEQLTEVKQRRLSSSSGSAASSDTSPASERAALTLQFRSIQEAFKRQFRAAVLSPSGGVDLEGLDLDEVQARLEKQRRNRGGTSIMDLGLDAINRVGQTCLEIAEAVDTTIEQWFDGFQNLEDMQRLLDSSALASEETETAISAPTKAPWKPPIAAPSPPQPAEARRNANSRRSNPQATPPNAAQPGDGPSAASCARRAQEELVAELSQDVAAREREFQRMQEECARLQAELRYASNKCSALSEENSLLRAKGGEDCAKPSIPDPDPDPITDFMAKQLEAILAEKAKLAQDNARLLRENTTLQDMLTIGLGSDEEEEVEGLGW